MAIINIVKSKLKVGLSPFKQNFLYLLQWKPSKNDEKCFLFHLFVLKIVKFLSWLIGYVEKTAWVER